MLCQSLPPPLKRKKRVTICLGFTCKDRAIVLATDSQMTWPTYVLKGYQKIVAIRFKNGDRAALLKAGDLAYADIFHEEFENRAKETAVESAETIRNTAEAAIKHLRQKIQNVQHHESNPPGYVSEYLRSRPATFLIAYHHEGMPYVYEMDVESAMPRTVRHKFAAIGTGSDLASFILNEVSPVDLDMGNGIATARYAVEMCIEHAIGCGGPVKCVAIRSDGSWIAQADELEKQYAVAIREVHARFLRELPTLIHVEIVKAQQSDQR